MNTTHLQAKFNLEGQVFVVTGASSGIGRAMAGFLSLGGASVVLVARREAELQQAAAEITADNGSAEIVVGDLCERDGLPALSRQCEQAFGKVDGVVNAAGINLRQPVDEITVQSWDETLNLNLSVPFFFSREFIAGMKKRNCGRIINIASLQSVRAFPHSMAYGASKGGICQLTRAMSEAWSKFNITCNAIAPGFFPTALTAPIFTDPEKVAWAAEQTTIGRNGELEDLFGVTVFLASNASTYITGQTLYIDGGFTAR